MEKVPREKFLSNEEIIPFEHYIRIMTRQNGDKC